VTTRAPISAGKSANGAFRLRPVEHAAPRAHDRAGDRFVEGAEDLPPPAEDRLVVGDRISLGHHRSLCRLRSRGHDRIVEIHQHHLGVEPLGRELSSLAATGRQQGGADDQHHRRGQFGRRTHDNHVLGAEAQRGQRGQAGGAPPVAVVPLQPLAQLLSRAVQALSYRLGRRVEPRGDILHRQPVEVVHHHHGSRAVVEGEHLLGEPVLETRSIPGALFRRRRLGDRATRFPPPAPLVGTQAEAMQVAQDPGQPGARIPAPRRPGQRRHPRLLDQLLRPIPVAGQLPRESLEPVRLGQQTLDIGGGGSHRLGESIAGQRVA